MPRRQTMRRTDHATMSDRQAYRGYLIRENRTLGEWYISKDGHHIGTCNTLAEAKAAVDLVTDD